MTKGELTTVRSWTGREVRALRKAKRMSLRDFAAHLGVSDRMVSKWEAAGAAIRPRPVNQAALDTSLARSTPEVLDRFASLLAAPRPEDVRGTWSGEPPAGLIDHPADGKRMELVSGGGQLPAFYIDTTPVSNAEFARFAAATGHQRPPHWVDGAYPPALATAPVVRVTWHDAQAYASWASKSLPTVQQWERARDAHALGEHCAVAEWCATEQPRGRYQRRCVDSAARATAAPPAKEFDRTGFRCVIG